MILDSEEEVIGLNFLSKKLIKYGEIRHVECV